MTEQVSLPVLPKGWAWTTLGEVCLEPQYGWTTSARSQGKLHLLRTTDITAGYVDWDAVPFCKEEPPDKRKYLLEDGDIVISRAGSVGYSHLMKNPKEAVFASYLIRFRPLIDEGYLAHFSKSPSYWESISEKSLGIALSNVNATKLKQINVPLPPLPEQHRIVAKVEELFTRLDAGVEALKRIKLQLKRYRQSVLKAAFEGKLTTEWREAHKGELEPASVLLGKIKAERAKTGNSRELPPLDRSQLPGLPGGWEWVRSDYIFWFVTSGSRGWAKYYSSSGPVFLRIGNLNHDTISLDLSSIQRVCPPPGAEGFRTRVLAGDILVSITADVGMIALIPDGFEEAYINQHIALARSVSAINASYVAWFLASREGGQRQFLRLQRGATKMGLGLDDICAVNLPIAPLPEQHRIIQEIERHFSVADEIEKIVEQSLNQTERLRQSVLKRAFQGKLVPQDPDEEPAEKLLERIKAERARQQASYMATGDRNRRNSGQGRL